MKQDTKDKKKLSSHQGTGILLLMFIILLVIVGGLNWRMLRNEVGDYKLGEVLFNFPNTKAEYIGINKNQVIRLTKDGISAYNLKGEEVWTQTLTLDKVVVKQKEPYVAVANLKDRVVNIFSDKGKEGTIITDNPVAYFSINENGDVAIIEETKEGHSVSAYTKEGTSLSGKRVTYIESAGFPVSAKVLPGRQLLLASYIDIYQPMITSVLVGVPLGVTEEKVDNISFGIEVKNNLVYGIESMGRGNWAAIGDGRIDYYTKEGRLTESIEIPYLIHTPYVESGLGAHYLPIVGSYIQGNQSIQGNSLLVLLDNEGKKIAEKDLGRVTYFRADEHGVVVGEGKRYIGLDTKGEVKFKLHTAQDVDHVGYVGNKLVALTKNSVLSLEKISEVK